MTWQLILTNPEGDPRPFVIPSFMFGGTNHGNAEEATNGWLSIFDDARRGTLYHYPEGTPFGSDAVMFTDFNLQAPGWQLPILALSTISRSRQGFRSLFPAATRGKLTATGNGSPRYLRRSVAAGV